MKLKQIIQSSKKLSESVDSNDPVLIALRAAQHNRKQSLAAQKERMKKRVYGQQRERLEDALMKISQDLKDAYAHRGNIYSDMEAEAGEASVTWSDDDANRYGTQLNLVDDEIESLIKKRNVIEAKLLY
jgi:multidrug efflux pump subunit AcrB